MKFPKRIQLVNQDDDKSCSLACVAMLTGKSLLEVRVLASEIGISAPCSLLNVSRLLTYCGLYSVPIGFIGAAAKLYVGEIYLVSAISLNRRGIHHMVLDCREEGNEILFDPQEGNEGKLFHTLDTLEYLETLQIIEV